MLSAQAGLSTGRTHAVCRSGYILEIFIRLTEAPVIEDPYYPQVALVIGVVEKEYVPAANVPVDVSFLFPCLHVRCQMTWDHQHLAQLGITKAYLRTRQLAL